MAKTWTQKQTSLKTNSIKTNQYKKQTSITNQYNKQVYITSSVKQTKALMMKYQNLMVIISGR